MVINERQFYLLKNIYEKIKNKFWRNSKRNFYLKSIQWLWRCLPVGGSSSQSPQTLWKHHRSSSWPSCRWLRAPFQSESSQFGNLPPGVNTNVHWTWSLKTSRIHANKKINKRLTSTALSTSLNTDRCFLLSVLARCLLQSVANAVSFSHSSSQPSNSNSLTGILSLALCSSQEWYKYCQFFPPLLSQHRTWTHWVNVPGQLKEQSNGLPCSDPHVDVIALQQPLQFGQVSAHQKHTLKQQNLWNKKTKKDQDRLSLMQDVFELIGWADGEQQCPRQKGVDVELARLRIHHRTGTICLGVGPGEQVLETFHCSLHVLGTVASVLGPTSAPIRSKNSTNKVIMNLPKYHPLQQVSKAPDLSPPIKKNKLTSAESSHSSAVVSHKSLQSYSQLVWLGCWLIHLPGGFWRWASGYWTPPCSQSPSPAECTGGRLKKPLLAAPHLYLAEGETGWGVSHSRDDQSWSNVSD